MPGILPKNLKIVFTVYKNKVFDKSFLQGIPELCFAHSQPYLCFRAKIDNAADVMQGPSGELTTREKLTCGE